MFLTSKKSVIRCVISVLALFLFVGCGDTSIESNSDKTTTENSAAINETDQPAMDDPVKETETMDAQKTEPLSEISSDSSKDTMDPISKVRISLNYERMPTHASNQIAIWVEDENGGVVKNILVTDFTGSFRGYRKREDALPAWVRSYNPEQKTDDEIDAISHATPDEGSLEYMWDMTDDAGKPVPDGIYTIKVEATLYWTSNVLYTAKIDTQKTASGSVKLKKKMSEPENGENANMISALKIKIERSEKK